ncbi:hypothetical protein AB834_06010 [PVC group bacterium (ex Bugula neritina AB1)]|nr:hypothetical protein AB834_06010 [PVC group bacterium (ex Bugula neritina AB1)]
MTISASAREKLQVYVEDLNRNEISSMLEIYISEKTLGKILDVSPVFISRNWQKWAREYSIEPINLSGTKACRRYLRWKMSDVEKLFEYLKADGA